MSRKKVQPINPNADCFVSAFDEDTSKSVSYKEIIGYGDDGEVLYDVVRRPRSRNGSGFVISYTAKLNDFLRRVSAGSVVRVFLYIAHNQSYGQNGQFGMRCSHRHIEEALQLDRSTVWDALKFLKDKRLLNETRVDGCCEFMVNPEYVTIGADRNIRVREWQRRCGIMAIETSRPVITRRPVPSVNRNFKRDVVECDMN